MPAHPIDAPLLFAARFETPTRYYVLRCGPDLFGDLVLSRCWGGKGSRRGGASHQALPSWEAAERLIAQHVRLRTRRGYRVVSRADPDA